MKARIIQCWVLLFMLFPLTLLGEEWIIYGARARAMGGAQVAIPQGAEAAYWNPAALALDSKKNSPMKIDLEVVTLDLEAAVTGGLLTDIYDLQQVIQGINGGISGLQNRLSSNNITVADAQALADIIEILGRFNKDSDKGVYVNLTAGGLNLRIGQFAITSMVTSYAGINPVVDLTNTSLTTAGSFGNTPTDLFGLATGNTPTTTAGQTLANNLVALVGDVTKLSQAQANELIYQAEQAGINVADPQFQQAITAAVQATVGGGGLLSSNQTGVWVKGLLLAEVRGTASLAILPNILAVGGNVKILQGVTFNRLFVLQDATAFDQVFQEVWNNLDQQKKEQVKFSADIAALLQLGIVRVGVTARNIIPVEFDALIGSDFRLDTQVRAGVAVTLGWVTLAVDADIAPNRSFAYREFRSQIVSAGAEFMVLDLGILSLALRAGIYRNVKKSKENEVYTAGVGLKVWLLSVDAAIAVDSKAIKSGNLTVDKDPDLSDIPDRVGYAVNVGLHLSF